MNPLINLPKLTTVKSILLLLLPVYLFLVSEASYARHTAIVIDADTGNILHEVEANQPWYPASLTKVMTLYMTFEALRAGQIQLGSILTASDHAASQPKSKLGLRRGESLNTRDAILAVITRSANDAAVVLAEAVGGTEDNFAAMMTARARSLGMNNTRFMNATGLPNNWQVTTSRDLALLAWRIQRDFPSYYQYFSAHEFYYKGQTMRAINAFTAKYPGAEGMKTGFTCGSGYNLIGAAHQNDQRLIGVVMGGMTSQERYQLMNRMMDNAFANYYSANPSMTITDARPYSSSEPPYQLSCGNGAARSYQAANTRTIEPSLPKTAYHPIKHATIRQYAIERRAHKTANLPAKHANRTRYAKAKPVSTGHTKLSNSRVVRPASRLASHTKSTSRPGTVGKTKLASHAKVAGKTKTTAATTKTARHTRATTLAKTTSKTRIAAN